MKKANFVLLKFGSPDPHFLTCVTLGGLTWRFNQGLLVAVDGRVGALCCDLPFGHAEVGSNAKDHFVLHVGDQRGQISVRKKVTNIEVLQLGSEICCTLKEACLWLEPWSTAVFLNLFLYVEPLKMVRNP